MKAPAALSSADTGKPVRRDESVKKSSSDQVACAKLNRGKPVAAMDRPESNIARLCGVIGYPLELSRYSVEGLQKELPRS